MNTDSRRIGFAAAIPYNPHAYQLRGIEGMVGNPGYALFADPG